MRISGATRLLAVVGDPVVHSLSPIMHNAAIAALGFDAVYVAIKVKPVSLPHVLRGFEATAVAGNITVPHKLSAHSLMVRSSALAADVGAVNTFWLHDGRLIGDNTDVAGVVDAVARLDAPGPWLLAGTGGSARAVAVAARELSVSLLVRSRDPGRGKDFVSWAKGLGVEVAVDDGSPAGSVINATPVGLAAGDPLPVPAERVAGAVAALDLVYAPGETQWCRACRGLGLRAADGRDMLVAQGAEAFTRFFDGVKAPREVMAAAVARALS